MAMAGLTFGITHEGFIERHHPFGSGFLIPSLNHGLNTFDIAFAVRDVSSIRFEGVTDLFIASDEDDSLLFLGEFLKRLIHVN